MLPCVEWEYNALNFAKIGTCAEGDVINIASTGCCLLTVSSLDCCMHAGACVCNEANLSGEAMPMQKKPSPVKPIVCSSLVFVKVSAAACMQAPVCATTPI